MTDMQGLSASEVIARRARGEGNDIQFQTTRSYAQILRENVFTFINDVLFGLGIALVLLGRVSDAVVSVGVVLTNVLVSVIQEIRAKRTLDRIALLTRPKATVIREGREQPIDPREIVRGDLLVVRSGDQIVVDGQVVGDGRMDVDESLLTGESDLVPKRAGDVVYSGTFCVNGGAVCEAQKVGAQSWANQVTAGARAFRRVYTPLQQQINLVIRVFILVVVYFEILLAASAFVNEISIVESVKMSVVLAGLVPNGLFLAIAVAYALGAVRIARQGALVQQSNAIESLSNVDVLCLDKTGTLTANKIKLHATHPIGIADEELRHLLGDYAMNTTARNRTIEAISEACEGRARHVRDEVPFSSVRKWSALAFDDDARRGVYSLGAPEMLQPYLASDMAWKAVADEWATRGLRVVLFAHHSDLTPLNDASGQPSLPRDLIPLGVVSFSDELRPEARATLNRFGEAGIAIKIISGDNAQTVAAVARQAGIAPDVHVVSGTDLTEMEDAQIAQVAEETTIFGRITPQQKEKLVQSLKSRGHYVAMIGDGVNDVLSLKQANLGIAMESGSQATRSVADIVLLDDSFAALPRAFQEGQRILNGMEDILKVFLTRILYVSLLFLSVGLVGGFPFGPKQSSLLALFTVGIPTIALAVWANPGVVPRRNLMRSLLNFVLPAALSISLVALGVYLVTLVFAYGNISELYPDLPDAVTFERALTIAQSALTTITVLCGLLLLPFVKPPTRGSSSGDWRPTILALVLLIAYGAILATPALRRFFEMQPLEISDYLLIGIVAALWAWVLRWSWRIRLLDRFLNVDLS